MAASSLEYVLKELESALASDPVLVGTYEVSPRTFVPARRDAATEPQADGLVADRPRPARMRQEPVDPSVVLSIEVRSTAQGRRVLSEFSCEVERVATRWGKAAACCKIERREHRDHGREEPGLLTAIDRIEKFVRNRRLAAATREEHARAERSAGRIQELVRNVNYSSWLSETKRLCRQYEADCREQRDAYMRQVVQAAFAERDFRRITDLFEDQVDQKTARLVSLPSAHSDHFLIAVVDEHVVLENSIFFSTATMERNQLVFQSIPVRVG